ncbi:MAG: GtrA family protein [Clostridiales bacterium]|nr:GtrA family protein [Clostridiales bacterium]
MIENIRKALFKKFGKESSAGRVIDKLFTKEIITYFIFGVLTTLVNWAIYTVLVHFAGVSITFSNSVAWVGGVLFAFVTNKIWVFESKSLRIKTVFRELIAFVAARAATGVLEIFGVPLLVKIGLSQTIFGVEGALSKVIVSVAVIILNYVFSKMIVFKNSKEKGADSIVGE